MVGPTPYFLTRPGSWPKNMNLRYCFLLTRSRNSLLTVVDLLQFCCTNRTLSNTLLRSNLLCFCTCLLNTEVSQLFNCDSSLSSLGLLAASPSSVVLRCSPSSVVLRGEVPMRPCASRRFNLVSKELTRDLSSPCAERSAVDVLSGVCLPTVFSEEPRLCAASPLPLLLVPCGTSLEPCASQKPMA